MMLVFYLAKKVDGKLNGRRSATRQISDARLQFQPTSGEGLGPQRSSVVQG
jgi:hypothetical protein